MKALLEFLSIMVLRKSKSKSGMEFRMNKDLEIEILSVKAEISYLQKKLKMLQSLPKSSAAPFVSLKKTKNLLEGRK